MPKTILLADDSVTIQKVVAISFASEDATVVSVDNGDDAIAKAREIRPDIVLADAVMPGKSGYEVCEAIKADPELASIPVLLLTGTFEAFDEARAREVGSAGHIAKPFEAQSLINEVRRLIEAAAASATPPPAATPAAAVDTPAADDGAFDFFDDMEGAQDLRPEPDAIDTGADLEFESPAAGFAFGEDDLEAPAAPLERPTPSAPGAASDAASLDGLDASSFADAAPLGAALERPPAVAAGAAFEDDSLDDSLAPDASRSGDQPFDFALDEPATDPTDPLGGLGPLPPVDADDLAQATVIDPLGASGYDVSSSDLRPLDVDAKPEAPLAAEAQVEEAELTVLAPESEVGAQPDADPIADDLTSVADPEPAYADFATPPQVEPIAVAVDGRAPAELGADLYAQPAPPEAVEASTAGAAAATGASPTAIAPELRQQLHDALEKIAWESFGDLTEAIVRQSVERVEAIAWEVIPRMAEVLIQEEIRRMKAEPDDA